jgi:dissimilatory sulfite reductase (desulfoviridin) alpha/beta subunit
MNPMTHDVRLCRGTESEGGCPHGLDVAEGFGQRLDAVIRATGWPEFLLERRPRPHRHHAFSVAVSACPNGCSRPHIADVGLIRACVPSLDPTSCTGCGECAESCPDAAMDMASGLPDIDAAACLRCGHCVRACPTGAMGRAEAGWRVLLGGRLGRRPALGAELPGLHDDTAALAVLERGLRLFMGRYGEFARFGLLVETLDAGSLAGERP